MNIYIIRHGEVYNPRQIFYGRLPRFSLSQKGRDQIAETAKYLLDKKIEAIYASPLLRTRQTAVIIQTALGLRPFSVRRKLLEIRSSLQGKSFEFMKSIHFDFFFSDYRDASDETMEQISDRMQNFIKELHKKTSHENVVIVTHGDPIMILKATIEGLPLALDPIRVAKYVDNGEVLLITGDVPEELAMKSVFIP